MSKPPRSALMAEAWPHLFRLVTPVLVALVLMLVSDLKAGVAKVQELVPVVAAHGARLDALEKTK